MINIPSLKDADDWVFANCTSLTSVVFSDTSIPGHAFDGCTSLASVALPVGTTYIGSYAFSGCVALTSLEIPSPSRIGYVSEGVFKGCVTLTWVKLPKTVQYIESFAFDGCSSFASLFFEGTSEDWENVTIHENNDGLSNATIYFYSETGPSEPGNYWHYVEGVPTRW